MYICRMKKLSTLLVCLLIWNVNYSQRITDTEKHIYAGMGVAISSTIIAKKITQNNYKSVLIGFAAGCFAGYAKERFYDKRMNLGTCENRDMYNTVWGSLVGSVTIFCVLDLEKKHKKIDYRE